MSIEDDLLNASKMFVRAKLIPNNEKTSDVSEWIFKVDQDILPDWYEEDPDPYEKEFRKDRTSSHVQRILPDGDVNVDIE